MTRVEKERILLICERHLKNGERNPITIRVYLDTLNELKLEEMRNVVKKSN